MSSQKKYVCYYPTIQIFLPTQKKEYLISLLVVNLLMFSVDLFFCVFTPCATDVVDHTDRTPAPGRQWQLTDRGSILQNERGDFIWMLLVSVDSDLNVTGVEDVYPYEMDIMILHRIS